MPLFPTIDVGAPTKAQIRGFLQRLPYSAWLAVDASLDLLEDLALHLCSNADLTHDLNDSDFAFLPKGDNLTGELTTDRLPEDARPLPLESTDIKAIAGVASFPIKSAVVERTHYAQQGFV
eukprot:527389-Pyramimonas_sp.AAC.1